MSRFFNPDNGFFTFMTKVWDLIWVSILWTVCCLGIVTIGPASTALYYTVVKVIRRGRGYVTRSFFHSFKQNAKQGILLTVIILVFSFILWVDFRYAIYLEEQGNNLGNILVVVFGALAMLALFFVVWLFPILSRFTVGIKGLLTDAILISVKHFPTTLVMAAVYAGLFYLGYTYLLYIIAYGLFFFLPLILPGVVAILKSFLVERILKKYTPEPEGDPEETGEDQWYLE